MSLAPSGAPTDPRMHASRSIANTVVLVRHAPTSWTGRRWCGRADPPLTAVGRRVARDLADEIVSELGEREAPSGACSDRHAVRLLVSPARRARQTASPIELALGLDAVIDPDLVEVDVGAAEGLEWTALERRFPLVAAAIARREQPDWPAGETASEVRRRADRAVERILAAALGGPVVVVSHGAILQAIAALLVLDPRSLTGLGPAAYLRVDPLTVVATEPGSAGEWR